MLYALYVLCVCCVLYVWYVLYMMYVYVLYVLYIGYVMFTICAVEVCHGKSCTFVPRPFWLPRLRNNRGITQCH